MEVGHYYQAFKYYSSVQIWVRQKVKKRALRCPVSDTLVSGDFPVDIPIYIKKHQNISPIWATLVILSKGTQN